MNVRDRAPIDASPCDMTSAESVRGDDDLSFGTGPTGLRLFLGLCFAPKSSAPRVTLHQFGVVRSNSV